ncbi:UNVERIFIED_CONTAM: hypothetical protein FKN15_062995 [Acipenser sinensis]
MMTVHFSFSGFGPFGEHSINASWVAVQLVVHVGLSGMATTVTLEKCGHNHGYKGLDNCSFCPGSQCCVEGGPDCIDSVIDMDSVCKRVAASGLGVAVSVSKDAGRYLCDFTYYTSLYLSHGRSAFIHVPPLGKPYTGEDLGRALQAIVREMLDIQEQTLFIPYSKRLESMFLPHYQFKTIGHAAADRWQH